MKIERLTENKIRIILKQDDFKDKSIDVKTIMTKPSISQNFFLELLKQAKKEIGFDTDGYKLLIEGFSSSNDTMVFTITKYTKKEDTKIKKRPLVRKKTSQFPTSDFATFIFNTFDDFCSFCSNLNISTYKLASSSLYLYNNKYYLVLKNINVQNKSLQKFYNHLSEFGILYSTNYIFENKLKEYGKCIIKTNAINKTIKYFA